MVDPSNSAEILKAGALNWRDYAAIWGAGLSTALAIGGWLKTRPLFMLGPSDHTHQQDQNLRITIRNLEEKPVQIAKVILIRWRGPIGMFRVSDSTRETVVDVVEWMDLVNDKGKIAFGEYPIFIEGKSDYRLRLNTIQPKTKALIVFLWHRFWTLPFLLPSWVLVTRYRADQINRGYRPIKDDET